MSEYDDQANQFMAATSTTMDCVKLGTFPYFDGDKESRDVFYVTLKRGAKVYAFKFGDSTHNTLDRMLAAESSPFGCRYVPTQAMFEHTHTRSTYQFYEWYKKNYKRLRAVPKQPTSYSILACLTKSDPGTFKDFCSDLGYDTDNIKALDTYRKVQEEWEGVRGLFNSAELEQLQEIS
jgi:hypothetical protein